MRALAARYGKGNYRITEDGGVETRRGPGRVWRKRGHLTVTGAKVAGRPKQLAEGAGGEKITIYMTAESKQQATKLGNGNLSLGVRRALELAFL